MADKKTKPKRTRASGDPGTIRARQGAFIAAYGEVGSLRKAAEDANVPRGTVQGWVRENTLGFKAKYETSREIFREHLQDIAVQRVKDQGPKDNPVLLITLLNAHWPEKYRRDGNVVTNEVKEMMGEWKRWVREANRKTKPSAELAEAADARQNAIDEVEQILSRRKANDPGPE